MSVISKILNCQAVKKEIWQCQQKQKSARKLKKHLRKQESYFSKRIWAGPLTDTLIFPLDNHEALFFLINKPTDDQVHSFLSKLVYQFALLRRTVLKNPAQVFIVSFPMCKTVFYERERRGNKLKKFFLLICPHKACNPTTYILKNPVYAKLKIQDSLQIYPFFMHFLPDTSECNFH